MVGDRILTDVVYASKIGAYSILCNPIDKSKDPFSVKLVMKVNM